MKTPAQVLAFFEFALAHQQVAKSEVFDKIDKEALPDEDAVSVMAGVVNACKVAMTAERNAELLSRTMEDLAIERASNRRLSKRLAECAERNEILLSKIVKS